MIRVYTASKLSMAEWFQARHVEWNDIYFHARWLKHQRIKTADSPELARIFWLEDQEDVKTADAVLVYAPQGQHLRGALVEAGMALAYGIPVVVVGLHEDYSTWQYHPLVYRAKDWDEARSILNKLYRKLRQ